MQQLTGIIKGTAASYKLDEPMLVLPSMSKIRAQFETTEADGWERLGASIYFDQRCSLFFTYSFANTFHFFFSYSTTRSEPARHLSLQLFGSPCSASR